MNREAEPQMLGVGDRFGQQRADVIVMEPIDRLPAVALPDDQAEVSQHSQLLGDSGLRHLQIASQLADRTRTYAETAENPHAAGRGERLHRLRDRSRGVRREEREVRFGSVSHARIIACVSVHAFVLGHV